MSTTNCPNCDARLNCADDPCPECDHNGGDPSCECRYCELERLESVLSGECTCHVIPPCSWCQLLTEDEADVYWQAGLNQLRKYVLLELADLE